MKLNKLFLLGATALLALTSCDDFLDSQDYTGKNDQNFPQTEKDIEQMVAAVYKSTFYAPFQTNALEQYFSISNLFSDDMFGGAGKGDPHWKALGHLMYNQIDQCDQLWVAAYEAIARANAGLSVVDNIADEEKRNQIKGELLFHRAYNYYNLVQAFNNVPVVDKAPSNVAEAQVAPEQVEGKEIYKLIAKDLKEAVACMPSYPYDTWSKLKWGTVSRWAVETLMARAYLFYRGFYKEDVIQWEDEEGNKDTLSDKDAIAAVKDIIEHSKHELLKDYRSLWPYANEYTAKDYVYVSDLDKDTYYQEINPEVILAINFNYQAEWTSQLLLTNQYALFFGIRADANNQDDPRFHWDQLTAEEKEAGKTLEEKNPTSVYPFGTGWGVGPVNPGLYNSFEEGDLRRDASIVHFPSALDPNTFSAGVELTMYHNKKITAVRSEGGVRYSWTLSKNGSEGNGHYQASHTQPLVIYRLADVYLMHAELTGDATYLNKVRKRGFGYDNPATAPETPYVDIPATLENIQAERRHELAFEGVRWDDLRRWGIAEQELEKQYGQVVYNEGAAGFFSKIGDGIASRYKKTQGFFRIPKRQLDLSGGLYKQNPGWDGTEGFYSGE